MAQTKAMHFELPKGDNGRSRREWMDAFPGLVISQDTAKVPQDLQA